MHGILSSINTFVAQQVLMESDKDPVVFFRRYQAGFSVTAPDPTYSVCNCQRLPDEEAGACTFLNTLMPCEGDTNCTIYSENMECPVDMSSPTLCQRTSDEGCYAVDGFSADSVQVGESWTSLCMLYYFFRATGGRLCQLVFVW